MIARRFYFYKEKREKENNLECKMNLTVLVLTHNFWFGNHL